MPVITQESMVKSKPEEDLRKPKNKCTLLLPEEEDFSKTAPFQHPPFKTQLKSKKPIMWN